MVLTWSTPRKDMIMEDNMTFNFNEKGWGPNVENPNTIGTCLSTIQKFPFEPSLKPYKLGRVCDFTFASLQRNQRDNNRCGNGLSAGLEEELKFHTVDTRPVPKLRTMGGRYNNRKNQKQSTQIFQQKQQQEKDDRLGRQKRAAQKKQQAAQQARFQKIYNRHRTFAEWSIEPTPDWSIEGEIPLNTLTKLTLDVNKVQTEDIEWRGTLRYYNKSLDRISMKQSIALENQSSVYDYYWVSTGDDELIKKLLLKTPSGTVALPHSRTQEEEAKAAQKDDGAEKPEGPAHCIYVAATDQILACLMASPQAKYSWHINVTKIENKLILDKADGSIVDLLTVNEKAPEPPMNDDPNKLNRPAALGFESVKVNHNLRYQVLSKGDDGLAEQHEPAPFVEKEDNPAATAYRYRNITLPPRAGATTPGGKLPVTIITRGEVHAKLPGGKTASTQPEESTSSNKRSQLASANAATENSSYAFICAIHDFEVKAPRNWAAQIESQKGALLATEIRNNTNKFHKWVASALISGCDHLRLGYVTRNKGNSSDSHTLLSVQSHVTKDIGVQIGLNLENAWGIVRSLIDLFMEKADGRFVLLKDPMKPVMRLYRRSSEEGEEEVVEDTEEETEEHPADEATKKKAADEPVA